MADNSKWKLITRNIDWKSRMFPWGTPGNAINLLGRIATGDCERHHYCGYFVVDPHSLQRKCRDIPKQEFWDAWESLISLPSIAFDPEYFVLIVVPLCEQFWDIRGNNLSNSAELIRSLFGTLKHIRFDPDGPLIYPHKHLMWPLIEHLKSTHEFDHPYGDVSEIYEELVMSMDPLDKTESDPSGDPVVDPVGTPVGDPLKSESPKVRNPEREKESKVHSPVAEPAGPPTPLKELSTNEIQDGLEKTFQKGGQKAAWKFISDQPRKMKDELTDHLNHLTGVKSGQ